MALTSGSHDLGPASGRLLFRTRRSGLGRRAGHDLLVEVARWSAEVAIDTVEPAASTVTARVEAGSFEVREGTGGVMGLTDGDRAEILEIINEKMLHTADHPEITFTSTAVAGTPEAFNIEGDLTIMGVTRPVTVRGTVTEDRLTGGATVVQSRWGIKPYSAFFGQLKVADPIEVEFDLAVPG